MTHIPNLFNKVVEVKMKTLSLDKCPHGMYAISLNDEDKGYGTRLTPNKCCGRWDVVKSWKLSSDQLREIAQEFENAAEDESKNETPE